VRFLITAAWASNSYLAFVFTQRFAVPADAVPGMIFAPGIPLVYLGTGIMSLGYGTFLATDFALCLRMLPDPESAGKDFAAITSRVSGLPDRMS
jgi:hypothetical protein